MQAFTHHSNPLRPQRALQKLGYLLSHPLLHLQAAGKHLHDPRDLAQPDHLAIGDVGHVRLPQEGQHVVLAQAIVVDIAHDHHFVVLDVKDGLIDQPRRIHVVPGC